MAALPDPWKSLRAALEKLSERVKKIENTSPFSGTGMSIPEAGVTQVEGQLNLIGDMSVDGQIVVGEGDVHSADYVPGTSGWATKGDGTAEFKDITLYDLPNSMLASPTKPEGIYDGASGFAISTTNANKLTTTLTVPDGFTAAAITVTARVFVINPNSTGGYDGAGGEYVYGEANIAGFNGYAFGLGVSGNNGSGTNVSTFSAVLTGLTPGGSVLVQAAARTAFATIAASPNNIAELSGIATWYR